MDLDRYKEKSLKVPPPGVFSNDVEKKAEMERELMEREFVDRELTMRNLEHSQSTLRLRFNNLARQHLRCLNIMDFPNEALLIILEYVKGYEGYASPSRTSNWNSCRKDIQNTRLVCSAIWALFCLFASWTRSRTRRRSIN